jgi:hypothetical protein
METGFVPRTYCADGCRRHRIVSTAILAVPTAWRPSAPRRVPVVKHHDLGSTWLLASGHTNYLDSPPISMVALKVLLCWTHVCLSHPGGPRPTLQPSHWGGPVLHIYGYVRTSYYVSTLLPWALHISLVHMRASLSIGSMRTVSIGHYVIFGHLPQGRGTCMRAMALSPQLRSPTGAPQPIRYVPSRCLGCRPPCLRIAPTQPPQLWFSVGEGKRNSDDSDSSIGILQSIFFCSI